MRISGALASAALVAIIASAARADIIDRVVAVVDGHLITMSDVRTITALHLLDPSSPASPVEAGRDPGVEHLIDRILVLEEVERYAPAPPDDKAVDARLGAIARPMARRHNSRSACTSSVSAPRGCDSGRPIRCASARMSISASATSSSPRTRSSKRISANTRATSRGRT